MRIERLETPNCSRGRSGGIPRAIVLHTTEGSFSSAAAWFADPASGVSAHYLVGLDGRVAQLVDEEDTARHCGRVSNPTAPALGEGDPNLYTIGVEFEDGGDPLGVERPAAQYSAGGALLADVARRWRIPLDRRHVVGHREIFARKSCPGNLDIDRLLRDARRGDRIVCLLPARNEERRLGRYLEAAPAWCDAVVALDDGSTDGTRAILEESPLVETLLESPRRRSYEGWDDARNRNRLLEAAGELDPAWIVQVDADELIPPDDALAMRVLLRCDALRGCAYGLEHHWMRGPDVHDARTTWVYRLFGFEPGQRLPERRLHFPPVPTSIPEAAWIRTTIRLQHFGAADRRARWRIRRRYRQADRHMELASGPWLPPRGRDSALVRWTPRPPDLSALAVDRGRVAESSPDPGRPTLVCLLPARNAARQLAGYFESVARFGDAVVALDDGSTDGTAEVLAAQPLVKELLRNPRREGYAGWDDAANRRRLLDAAEALDPEWVMFLDADERIDSDDAAALRAFVEHGAEPGRAYGFKVFRMSEDMAHFDRAGLWVYRLFAYEPGLSLPDRRLHLVPVPESIDRSRWLRTTIRIQHVGAASRAQRSARLEKYAQADPQRRFQPDYRNLLEADGELRPWSTRPPGFPVLADPEGRGAVDLDVLDLDAPTLSAIVISRDDEARIEEAVRSVVDQRCEEQFEVIVVTSATDRTAQIVRERFPGVRLVELDRPALPGEARNAGLRLARGDYVSFPGSHVRLLEDSLAARVRAHDLGYAMVTGSMLNGTDTLSGWANYFLDHSTSLPGRPSGVLPGPPAHCSYAREALLSVGGFPEHMRAGEDTVVNRRLASRGHAAYRSSEIRLVHETRCRTPARLLRHHFVRGRALGRILRGDRRRGALRRRLLTRFLARYLPMRVRRISNDVRAWGPELVPIYRRALPLVVAGAASAWLGTCFELARTRALGKDPDADAASRAVTGSVANGRGDGDARRVPPPERAHSGSAQPNASGDGGGLGDGESPPAEPDRSRG